MRPSTQRLVPWPIRCLAAIAIAVLAVTAAPALSASLPRVAWSSGAFAVKPPVIYMSGDSSLVIGGAGFYDNPGVSLGLGRIRWTTYNRSRAVGWGLEEWNDCNPSCGGGTVHPYPVKLVATRVRANRYTRMSMSYSVDGVPINGTYAAYTGPLPQLRAPWQLLHGTPTQYPGFCNDGSGSWGAAAYYWGNDVVNLTCPQVFSFIQTYESHFWPYYFLPGSSRADVAGFRCRVFGFVPGTNPPLFTHGTGQLSCTTGRRGFDFYYSD